MKKWCLRLGAILFFASAVNFSVYFTISVAIRGDALGGKIANGRYWVEYKGDFTEVSRATYHYSYVHSVANWIMAPLGVIGLLLIGIFGRDLPKEASKPSKREYAFMLIGSAIGLTCGILLVVFVPRLLHSQALRTPWVAIPGGFVLGLLIGLFSPGLFAPEKMESQGPASRQHGGQQE